MTSEADGVQEWGGLLASILRGQRRSIFTGLPRQTPAVRASSRQASPQMACQIWHSPHSRISCSSLAWRPRATTAIDRVQGEHVVAGDTIHISRSSLQKSRQHEGRQSLQPEEGNRQIFGIRAHGGTANVLQRLHRVFKMALKATVALTTTTSSHPLLLMVTAAPADKECQDLRSSHKLEQAPHLLK